MHEIDGPGNDNGAFTEGDPGQGIPATEVTADWLNAVQEEIVNVIELSGDTLDKPDNQQLHDAILQLIADNAPGGGGGGGGDTPTGAMLDFGGASAPAGFALCDGGELDRTTEADLFAVIGTTFGVGDGSTTFNVPDLRGRATVGLDNLGGTSANRLTAGQADILGGVLGAESGTTGAHAITIAEMPSHSHSYQGGINSAPVGGINNMLASAGAFLLNDMNPVGGNAPHDHTEDRVQPVMAVTKIIKL